MDAPFDPDATATATPSTPSTPVVTRSVELDADVDEVLAALDDAELLSAWLGPWHDTPDGPVVVTDDGVSRRVTGRRAGECTRTWTWSPLDDPDATSTVTFVVRRRGDATVLTVEERLAGAATAVASAGAAATAPSVPWLRQLLALGAVLALGAPARV